MARQFVTVRFRPGDRRTYTYLNTGEPMRPGDRVKAPDKSGDGWNEVEVVEVVPEPRFPCKELLGKVTGADVDEKILKTPPMGGHKPDLFGGR